MQMLKFLKISFLEKRDKKQNHEISKERILVEQYNWSN
jgi:hypothetical protein